MKKIIKKSVNKGIKKDPLENAIQVRVTAYEKQLLEMERKIFTELREHHAALHHVLVSTIPKWMETINHIFNNQNCKDANRHADMEVMFKTLQQIAENTKNPIVVIREAKIENKNPIDQVFAEID